MTTFAIDLRNPVVHVRVDPGATLVLRGAYHSTFDGSDIDAATTTWPSGAPGGASVDAGGLIDFEAGGLHLSARDANTHVVEVLATGREGSACKAAHVASPCIVLRTLPQARSRLITQDEWARSLVGRVTGEVSTTEAAMPDPVTSTVRSPFTLGAGLVMAALAVVFASFLMARTYAESPRRKLRALFDRVEQKLGRSDASLAMALTGPVEDARQKVRKLRVDPRSPAGLRIHDALSYIDRKLDESRTETKTAVEREAADALIADVQRAVEAAEEANAAARG